MGNTKLLRFFGLAGIYFFIFAAAFWLLFHQLDNRLLWGDEAETAVLAKNVVKFGYPKTVDGVNHITLFGAGVDGNEDNVWTWSPWLQEYVAAVSFKIFGATTWAGRAPFAFIGWLCLIMFGSTVHRIYRNHWITVPSLLLFATSEIFLLHARQCRYYSISVFAEILLIRGIYQLLTSNQRGVIVLILALVLQFYSNYIIAAANLPALVCLGWMLHKQDKRFALWIPLVFSASLIAVLPWLIYARPWEQIGAISDTDGALTKIGYYVGEFHFHFLPLIFLLPVLGWNFFFKRSAGQTILSNSGASESPTIDGNDARLERLLLLMLPLYISVLLVVPGKYSRYLLPVLPIACLLGGWLLFRCVKWRPLAVVVLLVLSANNGISIASGFLFKGRHTFRWSLSEYVNGISAPYHDRFTDVLAFLKKETHPGETVFVFGPEFPLIFYTELKIFDGRLINEKALETFPDWVLSESPCDVINRKAFLPETLQIHYDTMTILVHNSAYGGAIPHPDNYEYMTSKTFSPFVIYKKRPTPNDVFGTLLPVDQEIPRAAQ